MSKISSMPAPYVIATHVIAADEGWMWRIEWWVGNVDVKNTAPTDYAEAKKAYKTARAASAAMVKKLSSLVLG